MLLPVVIIIITVFITVMVDVIIVIAVITIGAYNHHYEINNKEQFAADSALKTTVTLNTSAHLNQDDENLSNVEQLK